MKNARLIIAIVSSLLDEALILGLILWGLPKLGIELPIPITITIVILFAIFAVTTFKLGTRALKMKPLAGLSEMTNMDGVVVKRLDPIGYVKIDGEIWEAKSSDGIIEKGANVKVLTQKRLRLIVKQNIQTNL
jgi:membrane-bound ClpP family serine protease